MGIRFRFKMVRVRKVSILFLSISLLFPLKNTFASRSKNKNPPSRFRAIQPTSCQKTLRPVTLSDSVWRHIIYGDIKNEKVTIPIPVDNPHRLEVREMPVISGGMHSLKGLEFYLNTREEVGYPIPLSVIAKGKLPQSYKVLHNGKYKDVTIPSYFMERIGLALTVYLPRQAVSFDRLQKTQASLDPHSTFGYPLTVFSPDISEATLKRWIIETASDRNYFLRKTDNDLLVFERIITEDKKLLHLRVTTTEEGDIVNAHPVIGTGKIYESLAQTVDLFPLLMAIAVAHDLKPYEVKSAKRIARFKEVYALALLEKLNHAIDFEHEIGVI
ncbi:MAG: hypothetical protein KDD40_05770, partial [Bdellovibrionales bacterium]|nr:hypothetical protein [Bdellovibrionales bacterium]